MVTAQPSSLSSAPLMRFEARTPQRFYSPMNGVAIGTPLGPFDKGASIGVGAGLYFTKVANNGLIGRDSD
jgi:hypothetical protein